MSAIEESFEIAEATEDEDEIVIPPLSSYVTAWRFWCKFAIWPVAFLLVNVIAFSTLLVFDRREYEYSSYENPGRRSAEKISMFQTNTAVSAIILLVDFGILLKAAHYMEKEIAALDAVDEDTSTAGHHTKHLSAQVSRKMDRFLLKRKRPRVSLFVSLLYFAAVLVGAGCLSSLGLRAYSATAKMKRDCAVAKPYEQRRSKTDRTIEGLPNELQKWARRHKKQSDYAQSTFIHLNDGSVFFRGFFADKMVNESDDSIDDDEDYPYYQNRDTLISMAKDGRISNHAKVLDPRYFTSMDGSSDTGSQSFCCAYGERSDKQRMRDTTRRLLCVASGEDVSNGFRNISQPTTSKNSRYMETSTEAKVKAYNGDLYFEYSSYEHEHRTFQRIFAQMEIYKLHPDTMTLKSVANVTGDENMGTVVSGFGSSGACDFWLEGILTSMASFVIFPASYWLLREKQIPSGLAPAVLVAFEILSCLTNNDFAIAFGFVTAMAASICLLGITKVPRYVTRDAVVWAYYSIICYFTIIAWVHHTTVQRENRYDSPSKHSHQLVLPWWSFVALSCFVGVLLNHPVLQVTGWIGGTVLIFYGVFGSLIQGSGRRTIYDDDDYSHGGGYNKNQLWMVPAGLVIGCGLVVLGHTLTKYRAYAIYYARNMWRVTVDAANVSRGGDDMTTGLISRRDV